MNPRIIPFLWFDDKAAEAAKFYVSLFEKSKIKSKTKISDTPSGTVEVIYLELDGVEIGMMSAEPFFTINPSVSFLVACKTKKEVDALWKKLSKGASALMELGVYPFSERYGWLKDKFGVSWQIMAMGDRKFTQKITPALMFTGKNCGRAEDAIAFYASVFSKSKIGPATRYTKNQKPDKEGNLAWGSFVLEGQSFAAMDSARIHDFTFNEAVSLEVRCKDQKEIDYFWKKLSAEPKSEQCGWLKDKYGLSWQITPTGMSAMLQTKDKARAKRVTQAFLKMKKIDIAVLEKEYQGS